MTGGFEGQEPESEDGVGGAISSPASRSPLARRPQFWLALVVTVLSVLFAIRGIPFESVIDAVREADFMMLFVASAPFYIASLYIRALRWRHLAGSVVDLPRSSFFRSTALGFMANNLLPFRIGEVIRSWTLARDAEASLGSVVGTVVLERVVDLVVVLAMSLTALAFVGKSSAVSELLQQGSLLLLPIAATPILVLIAMRFAPDHMIRFVGFCTQPLDSQLSDRVESALRSFIQGLAALSGGSHLIWIFWHSILIWLVTSTAPILVGFWAFGVDLGGPVESLLHAWILLGAVGVAVAMPSAPGFIGPYQLAFTVVLVPFGVAKATALAMGILVWFVFWLTVTVQGLYFMRLSGMNVFELAGRSE